MSVVVRMRNDQGSNWLEALFEFGGIADHDYGRVVDQYVVAGSLHDLVYSDGFDSGSHIPKKVLIESKQTVVEDLVCEARLSR